MGARLALTRGGINPRRSTLFNMIYFAALRARTNHRSEATALEDWLALPIAKGEIRYDNPRKTRSVTVQVPVHLAEKVDLMTENLGRSRDWIVKQALSAWIDQEEERSLLTHEALADVDAGRVIDHQAVQAWADSLSGDR